MLSVKNLGFRFHRKPLFSDLSFEVRPGTLVHIAGPNGAGKSTLLSVLAGLLHAEKGEIRFTDPATGTESADEDRRIWLDYLPAEANGLFVKLDAEANLNFWSEIRGRRLTEGDITGALSGWGLDHPLIRRNFPVEKFSTGMKRRLALARLSLSPAPCWILDEPFYGLDTRGLESFRSMIKGHLSRQGMALVVSHDLAPLAGLISATVTLGAAT